MTLGARNHGERENDDGSGRFAAETARAAGDARLPWGLAWRLAAGQITAWGILYYAFTVVVGPMQGGTGWSRTFLNAGVSIGLLAWGVLALPPTLPGLVAFAVLFGAGNGVLTILRGTAIAELFGRERYPELNGALSAPAVLAKAASPLALAWWWSAVGEVRVVFAGWCCACSSARAGCF